MIFYSFRIFRNLFCQSFQICECKDKNFFPIYKTFFEVFFSHLYYLYSATTVFLVTIFAWAKLINFINMTKYFF